MKKLITFFAIIVICIPAALLTRHGMLLLLLEKDVQLIKNVLELTLVKNTGAAFGIFAGNTGLLSIVTGIIIFAIIAYMIFFRNKISMAETVSIALIAGGGISNLYERLVYGYVIDYINIQILPVFNVADMCVTVGCVLFVLVVFFVKDAAEPKESAENE